MNPRWLILTLTHPGPADLYRLRPVLKRLLRTHGLRCHSITESAAAPTDSHDATGRCWRMNAHDIASNIRTRQRGL